MTRPQIVTDDDTDGEINLEDAPGEVADASDWATAKVALVKADRSAVLLGPYTGTIAGSKVTFSIPRADSAALTDRLCVVEVEITLTNGKKRTFLNGPAVEIVKGLIP